MSSLGYSPSRPVKHVSFLLFPSDFQPRHWPVCWWSFGSPAERNMDQLMQQQVSWSRAHLGLPPIVRAKHFRPLMLHDSYKKWQNWVELAFCYQARPVNFHASAHSTRRLRCGLRYQISQNIAQNHNNPSFLSYSHKFLGFLRGFVNFSFFLIPFLKVFFVFFFERLLYFSAKEKETYQMVRHFAEDSDFCVDFFSLIALKNLVPPSQPIRCKSYANCTFNQSPFPRVLQFLCFFLRVLIGFFVLICNCDLLGFPLKKYNESIFCFYKA